MMESLLFSEIVIMVILSWKELFGCYGILVMSNTMIYDLSLVPF